MWCLAVKVKRGGMKGMYAVLYHSPNSSHANFLQYLDQILAQIIDGATMNTLIGDFNIDLMKSQYGNRLINLCESYALKQKVNFITRSTYLSQTKIDLLFTNNDNVSCAPLPEEKISDHETIEVNIINKKSKFRSVEKTIISWENYTPQNLIELLHRVNWGQWFQADIEGRVIFMQEILIEAVRNLTSEKTIKVKTKNKWYDRELTEMNKYKFRLSELAKTDRNYSMEYSEAEKTYKKLIKRKKSEYIESQINESRFDQKLMWKNLKKIVKIEEKMETYDEVKFENIACSDNNEIRNKFNDYFINSIIEIQRDIEDVGARDEQIIAITSFKFREVSLRETTEIILSFRNEIGGKKLLTYGVLKDAVDIIAYFYMEIINESLRTGYFPKVWKLSTVVPIPKISGTKNAEEFRPINTLPVDEKIIETAVKRQLVSYIDEFKILNDAQSGFREKHSCETALNLALVGWKEEMDRGKVIVVVFLDLKRAFETIDRVLLLKKLESMGISGVEKRWFESYLSERSQQTKLNDGVLSIKAIDIGLPQGSTLSPILFILYINDIIRALNRAKANLFADDTAVALADVNVERAIVNMNTEMGSLYEWLCGNKLKLNTIKTKYMIIGNKNTQNLQNKIYINGTEIERVTEIKYLGIMIDEKLQFSKHCESMEKKISKK